MWTEIANKSYSYSHDDTMTDTFVKAWIEVDDETGQLRLKRSTEAKSPYIHGGRSYNEESHNVGNVQKPLLGEIVRYTSNTGNYHKFPKNWTSWDRKQGAVGDIIKAWVSQNNKGTSTSPKKMSDDEKRQLVIDKINTLKGADLDNIRRVLHIIASKLASSTEENIVKIAKDLLAYKYKHDPDHKNKPTSGSWERTEKGWRLSDNSYPVKHVDNPDITNKIRKINQDGKKELDKTDVVILKSQIKKQLKDAVNELKDLQKNRPEWAIGPGKRENSLKYSISEYNSALKKLG